MKTILFSLAVLALTCLNNFGRSPNVVVILTDDQGWGDLSINGNRNLSTPNIDRLGNEGLTLENFYVCQVCAPTRAEFLTGRYHPKTGVSGVSTGQERLNVDETTIADVFKKSGYATGAFGKWHNGTQPPYHPNYRGFDEYYGFTSGHWGHYFSPPLDHNGEVVRGNGYVVDDFTDKALEFIETNQARPFFCYIPYNTPHSPMQIHDRFYDKFENADIERRFRDPEMEDLMMTRAALAMCENIDWNVGRVLSKLDQLELSEDTIVLFFSDNGGAAYALGGADNVPLRGGKGETFEGGIRVVSVVRWPAELEPGVRFSSIMSAMDVFPTLAAAAGIEVQSNFELDGRNLWPAIRQGEHVALDEPLFFASETPIKGVFNLTAFDDEWKLVQEVRQGLLSADITQYLFRTAEDPYEQNNLAAAHPEVVAKLSGAIHQWRQRYPVAGTRGELVPPPGWRAPRDWTAYPIALEALQATPAPGMPPPEAVRPLDWQHGEAGRLIYDCDPVALVGGGLCK